MICRRCEVDKEIDAFQVGRSHGRPYRSKVCRDCSLARQKEVWTAKTEHTCHVCSQTLPIGQFASRTYRCRPCQVAQGRLRNPVVRQQERARRRARQGKAYTPSGAWWIRIGRGVGGAVNLDAHGWRSRPQPTEGEKWIDLMRVSLPHLYDPSKTYSSQVSLARYHLDYEFKAKQRARSHRRRTEEEGNKFFSDDTLTGPVLTRLFSVCSCPYCGNGMRSEEKSLDHIWPKHLGGWDSIHNVIVCCLSCNAKKHAMSPKRWLARLPEQRRKIVLKAWRTVGANPEEPLLAA